MNDIETSSDYSSESECEILGYLHKIYDSGLDTDYGNVSLEDREREEQDARRRISRKRRYYEIIDLTIDSDSD